MHLSYIEQTKLAHGHDHKGRCLTIDKTQAPVKCARFFCVYPKEQDDQGNIVTYQYSEQTPLGIRHVTLSADTVKTCFVGHRPVEHGDTLKAKVDTKGYIRCVNSAPITVDIKKGDDLVCINSKLNIFCKKSEPERTFGVNRMFIGDHVHTVVDNDEYDAISCIDL